MTPRRALVFGLRLYQLFLSPAKMFLFGSAGRCRYSPTCSHFAQEAIGRFGVARGSFLALKRLLRCHPWGGCGFDPVPEEAPRPPANSGGLP